MKGLTMESADTATLRGRLQAAWDRSDRLLGLLAPEAMYMRPIALRQPFIFYLGHLPAFGWNQVCRGLLEEEGPEPELDELFARGIDPVGVDHYEPDRAEQWPEPERVLAYRDRVREALLGSFERVAARASEDVLAEQGRVYHLVIEHELMHHETLLYMFHALPLALKRRPEGVEYRFDGRAESGARVTLGGGRVRMGASSAELRFGWDNEFPACEVEVSDLVMDAAPVRNAEFLRFVEEGGYLRRELWTRAAWAWRDRHAIEHPFGWSRRGRAWSLRTLFDELPLAQAGEWPVSVSFAEASAYARWRGRRLPTEAEVDRAAHGLFDAPRPHPWGDAAPGAAHGNFDFTHWSPTPVGWHPAGATPEGVLELVGNGWEWTSTVFGPYPGFDAMPEYPGYSRDFFHGAHYVLRGASWATDRALVRRTFRNWYQPHYPYVFAKFRLVDPA